MTVTTAAAWGALLLASLHAGASLTALWRSRAKPRRSLPPAPFSGRVLMIRPCAGVEPALAATLRSTPTTVSGLRIVLSTVNADDLATPTVDTAAGELRAQGWHVDARLSPTSAVNRKVGQLAVAEKDARDDETIIVVADSDVDLEGVDLDALTAPLHRDPHIAATWIPVVERPGLTAGDRASAALLTSSLHAFPLLGHLDARSMVGKLFAVRRDVLADVGGFESFCDVLGEDVELARRIWERGLQTQLVDGVATSRAAARSREAVVGRFARWLSVVRSQRPARLLAYPLLFAPALLLTLLSVVGALAAPGIAGAAVAVYGATRYLVARRGLQLADQRRPVWALVGDIILSEVLLMKAFTRALGSRTVTWRERRLELGPRGRLIGAAEHPTSKAIECPQSQ